MFLKENTHLISIYTKLLLENIFSFGFIKSCFFEYLLLVGGLKNL